MFIYNNPVEVLKTTSWKNELKSSINDLSMKSPLIITSKGNRERLKLDLIFPNEVIYSNVNVNPTFKDCQEAIKFCESFSFDGVVSIGGGSAMDLSKVVLAYLSLKETNIHELIKIKEKYPKKIPSIFLPTTHGTASEVTKWATIWNVEEKKKYSISNDDLYPTRAILDGNLTLSLPLDSSIITVMDALSHSFEAIWNKNANKESTVFAIEAICAIINNISTFKENPFNLQIRNKLLEASTTSGLAFSNTTTAAAHSISYPLTLHYNIPHGIASSISLINLLEINSKFIEDSLDKIYYGTKLSYNKLVSKIKSIPKGIIPFSLEEWKVPRNHLHQLSKESFTKGRMDNNIVDLNIEDVFKILQNIYSKNNN